MELEKLTQKTTDEHRVLAKEIIKLVLEGELRIEYGKLSKKVLDKYGIDINPHTVMRYRLGHILEICYALNLPLLPVVVVNQLEQKPNKGFYEIYDKLHNTDYAGNKYFEDKIRKQEKEAVKNCKDWGKLLDFLDIEHESMD